MPVKTPDGKWKWGNVERPSKKELVQTVYGIWKKNGSKGSFSKFLHGKHVDENTVKGKDGHWILFCDECDMNMTKAPDDQYLMIDDRLWEWVCNHGGKKLDPDEAVICRNCIEKRLGRPLTLKDLGDKKNLPANDAFKNMLKYGNRDIVSELCKAVAKHKVRDEDGDMVSVAFGGNCGIFAYTLLMFLNDVDYNFYEWRFGLFFDGIRSLSQIYNDNNDADLNHVIAIIDDVAYDGSGKTNLNKWYGKLFQIDDAEEVADIIDQFTTSSIGLDALYKIFEKEWKNLTKKRKTNESSGERIYAYHCTNIDPEIIKKEGWKVGNGFTLDNQFEDLYKKYLPKVPVFVSRLDVPVWDSKAKYCIKLDITGLELFPDFGYLPDFGAYYDYDEECFYWENEDDLDNNKKLKDFVLDNCDNLTLYADCFDGDDSFNVLGTACVDGSKLKDRIVEWKSSIKESYEPPYTLDTIKQKYGVEAYRKLRDDPVHRFRAETGIEVIHKEPTRDEFERIVKNWDLMTPEQKKRSNEFSMKRFGKNNKDRIDNIRKEYLKEYWAKNGRYFYCYDCDKNMSKAPDDQYIMIDDDLWEYVCKHGGKKIGTEEDLCRDCIEKRLGRPLTLKDLGDKINLPINDEIKKMLKKRKMNESETKLDLSRIPEDSMLDLTEIVEYKGPGFKEYSYLDNCIGGEGTLFDDASEMASWIYNFCQVIPISKVKDRLVGAPSELTDAIEKLEKAGKINDLDEIVCAIDAVKQGFHEPEEMMFIYVSSQDIHYFFECSGALSESINEAHEIHSYPEKLQPTLERIVKDNEDYELDHAYFNKEGKFIWMRNSKGYFHVFKPVKFVKTPGMTKPFGFKDLILKDNGMLEEVDRLRFVDGNEGLSYLSKRYNLDIKEIK